MFGLKKFAGLGDAVGAVSFTGASIEDAQPSGTASVELEFRADGSYWKTEGGVATELGNWIAPQLGIRVHEVRFTSLVGDAPTNATAAEDAWHSFRDGDFSILYQQDDVGNTSADFNIEVRRYGIVQDSAAFDMAAAVQA